MVIAVTLNRASPYWPRVSGMTDANDHSQCYTRGNFNRRKIMATISVLDYFGVEWLCDQIQDGNTLTAAAAEAGVPRSTLLRWVAADPVRSARVREARQQAGAAWDDLAEQGLKDAKTPHQLAIARELAHHYRWRARAIDPQYKEKVQQEHTGDLQVTQIVRKVID